MPFDNERYCPEAVSPESPEGLFMAAAAAREEHAAEGEKRRLEAAVRYGLAALRGEAVAE